MQQGSTIILRGTVYVIGIIMLGLCIFWLPHAIQRELAGDFDYFPILAGLYIPAIPFFVALYQTVLLLKRIDKGNAFSVAAVRALKNIKHCAAIICVLFVLALPYGYMLAERDDAPGIFAIGLVITFASLVIATFAAVLQRLLDDALALKHENDLTV